MNRRSISMRCTILSAVLVLCASHTALGQERRRASPPPDGMRAGPVGTAVNPRFPFAGTWSGTRTMLGQSPDAGNAVPIVMTFDVIDSMKVVYSGSTMAGPRKGSGSPHLKSTVNEHTIEWEEKNIGAGYFAYSATLVTSDSIAGTVKLIGGNLPGPPYGIFSLVRQPAGEHAR
ncbi:MAG: hypothetical protein U0163_00840 [Gemmatimonadaceae bacterium]